MPDKHMIPDNNATMPAKDRVKSCCQIYKHCTGISFRFKTVFSVLDPPSCLVHSWSPTPKSNLLSREQWIDNGLDWAQISFWRILKETQSKEIGQRLFGSSVGVEGFGIATTRTLRQTLGILRLRKQEERKPRNQDFKAAPAWMIISGHMELDPGALPGSVFCMYLPTSRLVIIQELRKVLG